MTAYGFDLDGTLDKPAVAQLANDLYDAGHEVYVVTGGLADSGEWTEQARKERLAVLGIRCTGVVRVLDPDINRLGAMKGEACSRLGIAVMVDDSANYLLGVATTSRATRLLVL